MINLERDLCQYLASLRELRALKLVDLRAEAVMVSEGLGLLPQLRRLSLCFTVQESWRTRRELSLDLPLQCLELQVVDVVALKRAVAKGKGLRYSGPGSSDRYSLCLSLRATTRNALQSLRLRGPLRAFQDIEPAEYGQARGGVADAGLRSRGQRELHQEYRPEERQAQGRQAESHVSPLPLPRVPIRHRRSLPRPGLDSCPTSHPIDSLI